MEKLLKSLISTFMRRKRINVHKLTTLFSYHHNYLIILSSLWSSLSPWPYRILTRSILIYTPKKIYKNQYQKGNNEISPHDHDQVFISIDFWNANWQLDQVKTFPNSLIAHHLCADFLNRNSLIRLHRERSWTTDMTC